MEGSIVHQDRGGPYEHRLRRCSLRDDGPMYVTRGMLCRRSSHRGSLFASLESAWSEQSLEAKTCKELYHLAGTSVYCVFQHGKVSYEPGGVKHPHN